MMRFSLACSLLFLLTTTAVYGAQENAPALLQANSFLYDQKNDVFTAEGKVELEQDGQLVFADRMIYNRRLDTVSAEGNVSVVDKDGQVYFANKVDLQQRLKTGVVQQIGLVFADGSRAAAAYGEQKADNTVDLENVVYSPCNLCADDPHKPPLWQLRAQKVIHDKNAKDIIYKNATMEVYGRPIAYTPYFSHPDPSVTSRSGFLKPIISADSKKGGLVRNYYYYNIDPTQDATFEGTVTQRTGNVFGADWRKRFSKGMMNVRGSLNHSTVRGGADDDTIIREEDWRGHFFADGSFDLTEKWRSGFMVRKTVDDYYLKDFDYANDDVLTNTVYAERFDNRDYSNINLTAYQDLRPNIDQDQPDILPSITHRMMGSPNQFLDGRWAFQGQTVTLLRKGSQSMSRLSLDPEWERRDIIPGGAVTTLTTKMRNDIYWTRKPSPYDPQNQANIDATATRSVPIANLAASYPLIRAGKKYQGVIEPKMALTVAPNFKQDRDIPNEDSRDVQLDVNNLFEANRFPGYDRIENGSHFSYGVKAGGYENNGNSAFVTVGQSYRISNQNPFPNGSGLEDNRSDLVGQIETSIQDLFYVDYRFQLDQENFNDKRHELQTIYADDQTEARITYLFDQQIEGTGLDEGSRHQLNLDVAQRLAPHWSVAAESLYDLSGDSGLLNAGLGLQYKNECLRATLRGERDLTDRSSGGSESRVIFSIGLRNLGGYDTPLLENDPLFNAYRTRTRL